MAAMPSERACRGSLWLTAWPATGGAPASGVTAPVMTLDQGRFAGAVLADEGVHFAGTEFEARVPQSVNSCEGFRNGGCLQQGRRSLDKYRSSRGGCVQFS